MVSGNWPYKGKQDKHQNTDGKHGNKVKHAWGSAVLEVYILILARLLVSGQLLGSERLAGPPRATESPELKNGEIFIFYQKTFNFQDRTNSRLAEPSNSKLSKDCEFSEVRNFHYGRTL